MIAGVTSDVCGAGGGTECGFEMKYLRPKVLILNMGMHGNLYPLTLSSAWSFRQGNVTKDAHLWCRAL